MKKTSILAAGAVVLAMAVAIGAVACGSDGKSSTAAPTSSMRSASSITVDGAWARNSAMASGTPASGGMTTPAMGGNGAAASGARGAAYMVIKNSGSEADALVSASSDIAANVEIHETKMVDGNASMSPVAKIDVPAGGSVELKPGGYHIMFIGLKAPFETGKKIQITLRFEKAGAIPVDVEIREQ